MQSKNMMKQQTGFTIVELMVATAVFSMVLMVILFGVLSFSRAYYSGVNKATTQNTARAIVNDVAESIQFSGENITTTPMAQSAGTKYYFCAGGASYYYVLGNLYDGGTPSAVNPGLYEEPGGCSAIFSSSTNGKELLAPNLRITYLSLEQSPTNPRLFTIGLGLAYGESDLLCNGSKGTAPGGCAPSASPNAQHMYIAGTNPEDVTCRAATGYEFCAHAGLSTTVSLRVANGALGP